MTQLEFRFEQAGSDTPVMRGPGVEVSFSHGNAWDHRLRFDDGSAASVPGVARWLVRPAMAIEDEIEPAEPSRIANPVYQAFVPHELARDRGLGLCALLTGSCFNHHFSAVLSLYPDPEMPLRVVFELDLADRCRGSIDKLAATYLVSDAAGTSRPLLTSSDRVVWQGASPGDGLLELIAMPPAIIGDPTLLSTSTRVQVQARIDASTHTQRLHYRWRWASCADLTR
jgi:hypothetical protein